MDAKMTEQARKLVRGHVSPAGRLSLPAEFRKAVGLEGGGNVVSRVVGAARLPHSAPHLHIPKKSLCTALSPESFLCLHPSWLWRFL